MLLEIDGATAEYWESPGKVNLAIQLAKGLVSDATPDLGDNDTVDPLSSPRRRPDVLVEAYGPAHPDEAWRRFTDPDAWPGWAPLIRDRRDRRDGAGGGCDRRVHGPAGVAVDFRSPPSTRSAVVVVDGRPWPGHGADGPPRRCRRPGGGSRAFLRVPGRAASAAAALPDRRGRGPARAGPRAPAGGADTATEAVRSFDFAFAPSYALAARPFGITPRTTTVEVGPRWLYVRYGPWRLADPADNIASAEVTGGFTFVKTAGPPHLSFSDRGVSLTTNGDSALCLPSASPCRAIDPTATITHPGATLSVSDLEGLAEALGLAAA